MKRYVIETSRCLLREFSTSDARDVYNLNLHPDIFRFTSDPPFNSEEEAAQFVIDYNAYSRAGFGRWAIESKLTGKFLGWCGLKYILDENEVDVGYRLLPEYWGNGYAVETAAACCKWGVEEVGLTRIVARVHKENFRSIRVAEKMNMIYEMDLNYDGIPWMNFILPIQNFKKASSNIHWPTYNTN